MAVNQGQKADCDITLKILNQKKIDPEKKSFNLITSVAEYRVL